MAVSVFTATFAISLNHQPTGIKHERKEYEKEAYMTKMCLKSL